MNNLYQWHNEAMVATKMADTDREMVSIRLLHDAGLSNPGLFQRAAIALAAALVKLGQQLHKNYTDPNQAYQVTTGKFAG